MKPKANTRQNAALIYDDRGDSQRPRDFDAAIPRQIELGKDLSASLDDRPFGNASLPCKGKRCRAGYQPEAHDQPIAGPQ